MLVLVLTSCSSEPKEDVKEEPEEVEPNYDTTPFTLSGKSYALPLSYQTLLNDGWEANSDIDQKIGANKKISQINLRNDSMIIEVTFYNGSDEEVDMKDANIAEIFAENRTFRGDVAAELTIFDGLDFSSKPEDYEKQLGTYEKTENEVFEIYTFNHTPKVKTVIEYYKDGRDGEVSRWIKISNFTNKR